MSRSSSGARSEADVDRVHGHATTVPAAFVGLLAAGLIDEDAAHGLGGGGKKVPTTIPSLIALVADEANVGFVDQRRGF